MRICILGASGQCGRLTAEEARAQGHSVLAVGRETSDLDETGECRRGDQTQVAFLTECFTDCDVVISALGLRVSGLSPFATCEDWEFLRRAGPAIAQAAQQAGVSRVLAITAGGAGDSYSWMPMFFRAFIAMTSMRKVYAELDAFEAALASGSVETCFVRPTGLTDEPPTGEAVVATRLAGRAQIPRADVARFVVSLLEGELPSAGPVITVTGAG